MGYSSNQQAGLREAREQVKGCVGGKREGREGYLGPRLKGAPGVFGWEVGDSDTEGQWPREGYLLSSAACRTQEQGHRPFPTYAHPSWPEFGSHRGNILDTVGPKEGTFWTH